jgi:Glycosyl hydrolase family 76
MVDGPSTQGNRGTPGERLRPAWRRIPGGRRTPGRPAARIAGLICLVLAVAISLLAGCTSGPPAPAQPASHAAGPARPGSYAARAQAAAQTLEQDFYNGSGRWRLCLPDICGAVNHDWGADSLTYVLYLMWLAHHDSRIKAIMNALVPTAHVYTAASDSWSDAPLWDSVADIREYQVTGNPAALRKAEAAFGFVASGKAAAFALGACPAIDYQQQNGGPNKLKTLETDANYVQAAALLFQVTGKQQYLALAQAKYAAIRRYFLDPAIPLYTTYVLDNGSTCQQLPHRFFGSVNGLMISNGLLLSRLTGQPQYRQQAVETAGAVPRYLSDASGVYADLQAENDIAEPLVAAMLQLAERGRVGFARAWLLRAASASASAVTSQGSYGRFFDGPPPRGTVTAWQVNGGFAVQVAAAELSGGSGPADADFWQSASFVPDDLRLMRAPVRFSFTGRAVAIIGTIGEHCCQPGHARVFIDGAQTNDQTGIWQNKSSSARSLPDSVLFAWRWPAAGRHTIEIAPGLANPKEGGSYFHMTGYDLVR